MAAVEGVKPRPGAVHSPEWHNAYEVLEDGSFRKWGSGKKGKKDRKSVV